MELVQVYTVTATSEEYVFEIDADIITADGDTIRNTFAYRPDDPYGVGPLIRVWLNENDYEVLPYEVPEVVIRPVRPYLWAAAYELGVADGGITGIEVASELAGAFCLDVGTYMIFFSGPLPDTNYYPKLFDGAVVMKTLEKSEEYFIIEVKDMSGNLTDPETFNLEIMRMQ